MEQKYELFFDMDGVLYPFDEMIIEQYNKDYNDNFYWRDNESWGWQSTKAPLEYFDKLMHQPGMFLKGKPIEESLFYMNKLHDEGHIIKIITMPVMNANCILEKIEWLKLYVPWIHLQKDVIMTGDKGLLAKSNRILIDDTGKHTQSWQDNGGIGITFGMYNWSPIQINSCYSMKSAYQFIKDLEKTKL